jgi:M6 family metalloprotease-like protein
MGKRLMRTRQTCAALIVVLLLCMGNIATSVGVVAQQTTLAGTFTTIFVDPAPGSGALPETRYVLTDDTGKATDLQIPPSVLQGAGGSVSLDRQRVTVTGAPAATTQANGASAVSVQTIAPAIKRAASSLPRRNVTIGSQPFINVLCKFSDVATEPQPPSYFDALMGTGPGSLGEYFSQASYGKINLGTTRTVGWFALPQTQAYYVPGNTAPDDTALNRMATDCAALIPNTVDMTPYVGINFMFNDLLGGVAIGGTGTLLTFNGITRTWASTWMPPWGYYPAPGYVGGQTVLAHEMGHAFELHHSAGPTGVTYQNAWDVMSDTYTYCAKLTDPTYGCLGQHMIAYDKDFEGWIPAAQKFTYAGVGQTITFGALADPTTPNYYLAVIPHTGTTTEFTTVEFRRLIGYDQKLAGNAVIIHEINTAREDIAWVVGTDGAAGAMFTAGMSYTAPNSNGVKVTVNAIAATTASVTIGAAPPTLQRIAITPAGTGVLIATSVQMTATGIYSDGSTQNLTGAVTWSAAPPTTATITAGGLVTAVLPGTATITAISGAIQGTTTVNVTIPPLPAVRPGGPGASGPPSALPDARPTGNVVGTPNPLPPLR